MDAVLIGLIGAVAGYVSGHLHAKIGSSSCMYGLCSVTDLNLDIDKRDEDSDKTPEDFSHKV